MSIVKKKKSDSLFELMENSRKHWAYEAEGLKLEVADLIMDMMEEQDINRSTLAEIVGVSPAYITKALRGYANLTLDTLSKFGFALGHRFRIKQVPLDCKARIHAVLKISTREEVILPPTTVFDREQYALDSAKSISWSEPYDFQATG